MCTRWILVLKARSNGSNILIKHYPTLLGGVRQCLISVGLFWMLECTNESNTIQQCCISVPGTKLLHSFDQTNESVGRCWMKSLDKVKLQTTSSNNVQHYPTCMMVLFNWVKHVASNVWESLTNMFIESNDKLKLKANILQRHCVIEIQF